VSHSREFGITFRLIKDTGTIVPSSRQKPNFVFQIMIAAIAKLIQERYEFSPGLGSEPEIGFFLTRSKQSRRSQRSLAADKFMLLE
jgi:hypothetical protein